MQKQAKLLDEELQLNHLTRIPDPIPKPANSFFRALSISLFSTHNETDFVKSIMKQTLQANCEAYENTLLKKKKKYQIAFPIISQSSELVKKYVNDKQMLQMYTQSPDLECFQNDNYELAAFTFNRRVSVFYLSKDGYLNETLISCCRNKTGRKILLCKVGKRFFAVEKESTRSMASFIREYLLGNMISQIVSDKSEKQNTKVHFLGYDQILINSHKKFPKIHKKSLSQCGDIINKLEDFRNGYDEEMDKNFHINIKNNYDQIENRSHQEEPKNLMDRDLDFDQQEHDNNLRGKMAEANKGLDSKQQETKIEGKQLENQQNVEISQQPNTKVQQQQHSTQLLAEQPLTEQPLLQQLPIATDVNYPYTIPYQQGTHPDYSQLQAYYQQNAYIYSNYSQYYPSTDYNTYYTLQQHHIYDPNNYYPYYQQQQLHHQAYNTTTYSQQPQQLINNKRYTGRLKFYDTNGKYGFIIVDGIGSDLFVHFDDLSKAGMTKEHLETHSASRQLRFQFTYYQYQGRNKKAKKAVDLLLLTDV